MTQQTWKLTTGILAGSAFALFAAWSANAEKFQSQVDHRESVQTERLQIDRDSEYARIRAETCILVFTDMPLTNGITAYYFRKQGKQLVPDLKRPFPNGAFVCDTAGNTAIVRHVRKGRRVKPIVEDIRSMPQEEMRQILAERGLIKEEVNRGPKEETIPEQSLQLSKR